MNTRRISGLAALLMLTGCASQHKPTTAIAAKNTPASTQPIFDLTKWEATKTPVDLLAQKTNAFSAKLVTPGTADTSAKAVEPDPASAALLGRSRIRQPRTAAPQDASPIEQPAQSAMAGTANDGPRILPESEDFHTPTVASKDDLGTRLRKRTRANPHDIADQLDLQLYSMLNDDPSPEIAELTQLPRDDQELIDAMIDGISMFRSAVREDSTMLPGKKIAPLLEMADRLRSQAELMVNNVTLCKRVDGFGKYDPINPPRFPAMQENKAIIYCEVENFLTRQEGAMWLTRLSEQVNLYSDTGLLAWSDDKRLVTDECRNRRHDFFAYNIIRLPASLTVGRYLLKVSMEDQNGQQWAEKNIPLEIVGK